MGYVDLLRKQVSELVSVRGVTRVISMLGDEEIVSRAFFGDNRDRKYELEAFLCRVSQFR